ncbi:MAG: glutamate-1-semialdehyde 2,1-aminomutase [Bacteroidota bacterium]|nr:glutamate-1-semialdehyde 2,1-aminomutase [Bacteroidota bacterium]
MITQTTNQSANLFKRAKLSIPGGVNSPVRAFKSVGGEPIFMKKAQGAYMFDADENRYIDYINSWGPMILGHCHPQVVESIQVQAAKALSFGTPTELEIEMAELIKSMVPNIDLVRLVSSGTEACMSALRLARGYTGKNKLIKFDGCYHGHADPFLVKAGSGVATFNIQTVPGVTTGATQDTLTATYNNLDEVKQLFALHKDEIAAVIIEPVAGNMGCISPDAGFLEGIRQLCDEHKSVLIFDEVMTGFRLALGGVQERLNINADLVAFGKVIGGGMPVGAFGGKKEIMGCIAPIGNVYQAGTLSGNPLAVTAGITTLNILKNNADIYTKLDNRGQQLKDGLHNVLNQNGIAHTINQIGSMISVFFGDKAVHNFNDTAASDVSLFNKFFHHMLNGGIYLPPSAYETWFISVALSDDDTQKTLEVVSKFKI